MTHKTLQGHLTNTKQSRVNSDAAQALAFSPKDVLKSTVFSCCRKAVKGVKENTSQQRIEILFGKETSLSCQQSVDTTALEAWRSLVVFDGRLMIVNEFTSGRQSVRQSIVSTVYALGGRRWREWHIGSGRWRVG